MKTQRKNDLRNMSVENLELVREDLKISLMKARQKSKGLGFTPKEGSSTKLVRELKKEIAIINTFINEKNGN